MKDISKVKKIFITTAILAILSFLIYGFLFWDIRIKNQKISTLSQQEESDIKKDNSLRGIRDSLESNKIELEALNSYFLRPDGIVDFIEFLEDLGEKSGIALTIGGVSTELDPKVKDDFKEILRLRLETSGSWNEIFYFLNALERLPYAIRVDNFSVGLMSASDQILFGDVTKSISPSGRVWKASFDISVIKIRQ